MKDQAFAVMHRISKLQWVGCEVIEARFSMLKAVIQISPCAEIPEHYEKDGFGVHEVDGVHLVWRKPLGEANDDRLCEQRPEALGAGDEFSSSGF